LSLIGAKLSEKLAKNALETRRSLPCLQLGAADGGGVGWIIAAVAARAQACIGVIGAIHLSIRYQVLLFTRERDILTTTLSKCQNNYIAGAFSTTLFEK
jgi:hypothetical protein